MLTQVESTNMMFFSACFQLQAYWLLDDEDSSARRDGVIKAFDTAIQLIAELESADRSDLPVKYLTFSTLRVAFTAAILISKVIHSRYGTYIDFERGKQAFNMSISLFRKCCVEDNDMHGRTTKVLAQLWSIHKRLSGTGVQQPPQLSLKSRLFFSIAHDALWQWREQHAGQPDNGAPSLPPPLMSPVSTSTPNPNNPPPINRSESSPEASRVLSEPERNIAEPQTTLGGFPSLSTSTNPQLLFPSSDFRIADSARGSFASAPEQDLLMQDLAYGAPDPLEFDMLLPDTVLGYADNTWMHMNI